MTRVNMELYGSAIINEAPELERRMGALETQLQECYKIAGDLATCDLKKSPKLDPSVPARRPFPRSPRSPRSPLSPLSPRKPRCRRADGPPRLSRQAGRAGGCVGGGLPQGEDGDVQGAAQAEGVLRLL